ncbi:hypothetical protein ABT061_00845 [Streptosporangium sp. NPDC002544]|uniref:hypothetical protein n=1 Tax=Streptosporangium sp. NPDC002544 TaxID=3154538 RepID=UPI00332C492B
MRKRVLLFLPTVMFGIAAVLLGLESMVRAHYQVSPYEPWSVLGRLGFTVFMLALFVSVGLGVRALHIANAKRDQHESAQGDMPEAPRNAWAAAGRWLARH